MKSRLLCLIPLLANAKTTLTIDPLTKLPLYPPAATGPDPVHMPPGNVCKSKFEGDLYFIDTPFANKA